MFLWEANDRADFLAKYGAIGDAEWVHGTVPPPPGLRLEDSAGTIFFIIVINVNITKWNNKWGGFWL